MVEVAIRYIKFEGCGVRRPESFHRDLGTAWAVGSVLP